MAIETNGIATKNECNMYKAEAFLNDEMTQCPTKQDIVNTKMFSSSYLSKYEDVQCVMYSDLTSASKTITFKFSEGLTGIADFGTFYIYSGDKQIYSINVNEIDYQLSSPKSYTATLSYQPFSLNNNVYISVGNTNTDRSFIYKDDGYYSSQVTMSPSAKNIDKFSLGYDWNEWLVNTSTVHIHIDNKNEIPNLN